MPGQAPELMRLAPVVTLGLRDARRVVAGGNHALLEHWEHLPQDARADVEALHHRLQDNGIGLLLLHDDAYPARLKDLSSPPLYLFFWGNLQLLDEPGIGMCGSRGATERGLDAARACGEEAASRGWNVISGYAKGVDTETHLAALREGAGTVIVLAEGVLNFRRKRAFDNVPFGPERVLVLSQFSPRQRWSAGAAMTRNSVIVCLGSALLVVEAGEKGGTLNAGEQALSMERNVLALDFSDATPPGNRVLLNAGARAVRSRGELKTFLDSLHASPAREQESVTMQAALF